MTVIGRHERHNTECDPPERWPPCRFATAFVLWRTGSLSYFDYRDALTCLFQEEIHAIEIDYGMTDVQRVHSQNTTDSCTALPQGEMR